MWMMSGETTDVDGADAADLELADIFDNCLSVFNFCKLPGMHKSETAKRVFHRTLWARDVARA